MVTTAIESTLVTYHVSERVGWITLNRPRILNAINTELAIRLGEVVRRAAADHDTSIVVVRGNGRAFCSGIDRTGLAEGKLDERFFRHWIDALNRLEEIPKISLAIMHGYSIGGGLQLALACDVRLATDDAVIELGATRHGLIPDGAVLRLARVVGLGRAMQLTLLNERVTPEEARAMGLVNYVCQHTQVDELLKTIIAAAAETSPTATAHSKRLIHASFHHDPRSLVEDLIRSQNECMASWKIAEANTAWKEKRKADFSRPPRS